VPIEFRCQECNKLLRVSDESAGKQARCPSCGAIGQIPSASGEQAKTSWERRESGGDSSSKWEERERPPWGSSQPSSAGTGQQPEASEFDFGARPPSGPPQNYGEETGNPFQAPAAETSPYLGKRSETTQRMVQNKVDGPATGLMIVGGLGCLIFGILALVALMRVPGFRPGPPPLGGFEVLIAYALGLARSVTICYGASAMKKLQGRSLAMTAAVLSVIPCLSGCCILDIPVGIWALVVLNDPYVSRAFTE